MRPRQMARPVCDSHRFVHLRGGMVVPVAAYNVVLTVERAGYRLTVDGPDILVRPGGLDPALLAELKRWKAHVIMLLGYTADDSHIRDTPTRTIPPRRNA